MGMPNFRVTFTIDATTTVNVTAKDKREAESKAAEEAHTSLCHQCARHIDMGDIVEAVEIEEFEE